MTSPILRELVGEMRMVEALKKEAVGSQQAPPKTCRHLALAHPHFTSGLYWVDPNGGSTTDAIQVYCNFETKATCVQPSPAVYDVDTYYTGKRKNVWFSDMKDASTFSYKSDNSQLMYLQLLSTTATQSLTYTCSNTVAFTDATTGMTDKALKFLSHNYHTLDHTSYTVSLDECTTRPESGKTVFDFSTELTETLPIEDLSTSDLSENSQSFGVEIGQVCFM